MFRSLIAVAALVAAVVPAAVVPAAARDCDCHCPPKPCWIEPWYCHPPSVPGPDDHPTRIPRPYGGEE